MARKPVLIRIPEELHDALAKWADDKLRSTNAQIEYLLQEAVKKAGRDRKPKRAATISEAPSATEGAVTAEKERAAEGAEPASGHEPREG